MHIASFVISPIGSNCYVLAESEEPGAKAVIIDPGDIHLQPVFEYIEKNGFEITEIWCTHGHFDHVAGVEVARKQYPVPVYLHAADLEVWDGAPGAAERWLGQTIPPLGEPDVFWKDGDVVKVGDIEWNVWHTPGHSPGSVCLLSAEHAFTGDTLFAGTIGRTDFPASSPLDMQKSLDRLCTWDDAIQIFPGHGKSSTMSIEKRTNPFLT